MNTFTIKQAKEMVGMVIPRMELIVGQVYERKTGEGQYGPWSLQNATANDPTGDIKVLFKQFPDQKSLSGRKLIFKSMEGRHGLKGLEIKSSEYKGKTTIELHVTKTALIVGSQEEENTVSQVEPSTRMPQNEPVEASEAPIRHEDRKLGIATAKNRLTQLAGLYDLCWKTVSGMDIGPRLSDASLELQKDIATTLFIQASREGLADKMPVRTIEKYYDKAGVQGHPEEMNQEEPADQPF